MCILGDEIFYLALTNLISDVHFLPSGSSTLELYKASPLTLSISISTPSMLELVVSGCRSDNAFLMEFVHLVVYRSH